MYDYWSEIIICIEMEKFDDTTMKEWLVKMTDKITHIVRGEKIIFTLIGDWKILMDILHKDEKNELVS